MKQGQEGDSLGNENISLFTYLFYTGTQTEYLELVAQVLVPLSYILNS